MPPRDPQEFLAAKNKFNKTMSVLKKKKHDLMKKMSGRVDELKISEIKKKINGLK